MILVTDASDDDVKVLRPTNMIEMVGRKITLPCTSRANSESRWDFYGVDAVKPISIYDGNPHHAITGRRFSIDFDICRLRTCHLTIQSVVLENAGYYVCFESSSKTVDKEAASLVVLGRLLRNLCYYFNFS